MKIGLTLGDPAGIGPEIVLKSLEYFAAFKSYTRHQFVLFGGPDAFFQSNIPNWEERFRRIQEKFIFRWVKPEKESEIVPGRPSAIGGQYALACIRKAVEAAKRQEIEVLVTAPIDKVSLQMANISQVDHSQLLKEFFQVPNVDTVFHSKNTWIYFYSKHLALKEAARFLNTETLLQFIRRTVRNHQLLNLSLKKPIAVAALNPHASDGGRFGDEEEKIIIPAIRYAREENLPVWGPVPADSVFALHAMNRFSAVISLYHDQGHIAAKTLDFFGTVSFSLGLPLLRVSVDHGTAMEIAGKDMASPLSMNAAIRSAVRFGNIYSKNISNKGNF